MATRQAVKHLDAVYARPHCSVMPTTPVIPTATDVARIAAQPDPVLRNALITLGYHELAVAVRDRLGPGANWGTFATWASRQAGRTIRGEDLREALRTRLGSSPELHRLAAGVATAVRDAPGAQTAAAVLDKVMRAVELDGVMDRAAAAVAAGNRKVFEEIGAQLALFLEALAADDPGAVDRFLNAVRPGDPPDGQSRLRDAFQIYLEAAAETSPPLRSQLLYYANLLIAWHEQVRLQPEIAAAMNCVIDEKKVRDRLVAVLLPAFWRRIRYRAAALLGRRPPLDVALERLLAAVQREIRALITANAMTLELPGPVTVRLGRGISGSHAPSLSGITEPRLAALLHRLDPVPDSLAGSAATDWSVLEQRLHLVADLFRCHHETHSLYDAPFTPQQIATLRSGRMPHPPF
jgi:hypothetical protein